VILWAVIRPKTYRRSWGRAMSAFAIVAGVFAYFTFGAMHAPPEYNVFLWWLIFIAGVLFVLGLVSAVRGRRVRRKEKRA
jgi:formate hydrogenlyase subunit 3/multisubunit Na+/H+ antiporter MnhD subunit